MNILIAYFSRGQYPLRSTISDHLYAFEKYSSHRCFYLNLAWRDVPRDFHQVDFDLVVYHTTFLSQRWNREHFKTLMRRAQSLKRLSGTRVALPQDEFLNTDLLCEFVNDFRVDHVFSVAPESEWQQIYPTVDRERVRFSRVLTGYLDDSTVRRIERLSRRTSEQRPVDVGYRAWRAEPWLGRHGFLKTEIAGVFQQQCDTRGLAADISTRMEDTLLADAWYEFLLRCKYTIGVEGGASILDRDGSIRARTNEYVQEHPEGSFEEVEAACFPGKDGSFHLLAISPRHLEACATRTCQVLVEGSYDGILEPWRHYIPLKRDFSNIDEVMETIRCDRLRAEMVEASHEDVVASGRYSYRSFVETIVGSAPPCRRGPSARSDSGTTLVWLRAQAADRLSWMAEALDARLAPNKPIIRALLARVCAEQKTAAVISWCKRQTGSPR